MNKLRRRQADQLHAKGMQGIPDLRPAGFQLFTETSFRLFQIILFQSGIFCQGIQEISVQADAGFFVYKPVIFLFIRLPVGLHQRQQGFHQFHIKQDGTRIQIHISMAVDRSQFFQCFCRLLMKKLLYAVFSIVQENAVVFSNFHR